MIVIIKYILLIEDHFYFFSEGRLLVFMQQVGVALKPFSELSVEGDLTGSGLAIGSLDGIWLQPRTIRGLSQLVWNLHSHMEIPKMAATSKPIGCRD